MVTSTVVIVLIIWCDGTQGRVLCQGVTRLVLYWGAWHELCPSWCTEWQLPLLTTCNTCHLQWSGISCGFSKINITFGKASLGIWQHISARREHFIAMGRGQVLFVAFIRCYIIKLMSMGWWVLNPHISGKSHLRMMLSFISSTIDIQPVCITNIALFLFSAFWSFCLRAGAWPAIVPFSLSSWRSFIKYIPFCCHTEAIKII